MRGQRGSAIGAGILEGAGGRRWEVGGEGLRARLGAAVGAVAAEGHGAGAGGRGAAGAHVADHPTCREKEPLMHRAAPGSASPDSWRWVGCQGKHPESIGNQDPWASRGATRARSCARLSLSQLRRGIAAPDGVGFRGKYPGCIPVGHLCTELHQAQPPPVRGRGRGKPPRGESQPQAGWALQGSTPDASRIRGYPAVPHVCRPP